MTEKFPDFLKCYKQLSLDGHFWRCVLIRDDEVERYNVCKDSLRTFGSIDKTTIQEIGWENRKEYIKNRLSKYECDNLLKTDGD